MASFQAPKGTRDFYPREMLRRRYVTDAWRSASVRFGFDEIDGPTFEHLDLYTIKSGEGIVSELFSFQRFGGEKDFALRPEFTPTLARMYAAKANSLPKPTKWFSVGPFFRAERPQRGRLREFLQWNVDLIGDEAGGEDAEQGDAVEAATNPAAGGGAGGGGGAAADAEVIACCAAALRALGLSPEIVKIRISHRGAVEMALRNRGVRPDVMPRWFALLDKIGKVSNDEYLEQARALGMDSQLAIGLLSAMAQSNAYEDKTTELWLSETVGGRGPEYFKALWQHLGDAGVADWCVLNLGIVRGLAYYTGMVFEVHEVSGRERAVAGGGRYEGLIQMMGGPRTPAVGFAMGDVVLSLVLEDHGLMPDGVVLAEKTGTRPDVFLIAGGDDALAEVGRVTARLRRDGLHVRRSYRATRNVGKLMREAAGSGARYAVILEPGGQATVKDLDTSEQGKVAVEKLAETLRRR